MYSLKAPDLMEQRVKIPVFGTMLAVEQIVAAHYRLDAPFGDKTLKRKGIDLAQCILGHFGAHIVAVVFLIITCKMFHHRKHTAIGHSTGKCHSHLRGKPRIFTEIFEIAGTF